MGYNGMVATYAWLCGGEFPSQRLRSYTFGLAAAVGFLGAWLATFTAPYFINPDALNWGMVIPVKMNFRHDTDTCNRTKIWLHLDAKLFHRRLMGVALSSRSQGG